jgi:hypothetical protein
MPFTREQIAKALHEMNRTFCALTGDASQEPWEEAATWQKNAAFCMVEDIDAGRALTGRESHEAWCEKKRNDGWVWGPVKDGNAVPPTHPDLKPYDDLSPVSRAKDGILRLVATAMLRS